MQGRPAISIQESTDSRPRLLEDVHSVARMRHLSLRTEQAYIQWIRRFILFHQKKHPREMGENEIRKFISHLAVDEAVAASTQTVALSALLFLYRDVPEVMTRDWSASVLACIVTQRGNRDACAPVDSVELTHPLTPTVLKKELPYNLQH